MTSKIIKQILCQGIIFIILLQTLNSTCQGFIPNDPEGDPWHFEAMKVTKVWDHGYDFRSKEDAVGICIVGDAITNDQRGDLNITGKVSFALNETYTGYLPYPQDGEESSSHEASLASVTSSTINNGIGVSGIVNAPLYSVWPWGNYPEDDKEFMYLYIEQMMDIFDWCANQGTVVISMSFIAWADDIETTDSVLKAAKAKVKELYETGKVLFFVASGNQGIELDTAIPQTLPYMRVIGQSGRGGGYINSNWGDNQFLIAPTGVPAYDQTNDRYGTAGGASCSAPLVAAAATLLWNQFPWATNMQIEDALVWGASDVLGSGWDTKSGYGVLNVEQARNYLEDRNSSSSTERLNWTEVSKNVTFDSNIVKLLFSGIFITGCMMILVVLKRRETF